MTLPPNPTVQMVAPVASKPKSKRTLTRLEIAIRIYEAVFPALNNRRLFSACPNGPGTWWTSESFHVATIATPFFSSLSVWPVRNKTDLTEHPECEAKVMNLHRDPYGEYELVSFHHGDWEQDLLRYVGAPLGLLTILSC
jgi:hypothetical protein